MTGVKADLRSIDEQTGRGLFDEVGDAVSDAASSVRDFFSGVKQGDVASGAADLETLSRPERIELLVDGETGGLRGSPWGIGNAFDASVSDRIHAEGGSVLVVSVEAGILDALQAKARAVRYAFVWDDAIVGDTGTLTIDVFGRTLLIVTIRDVPQGQRLTLWTTDDDLSFTLVEQAPLGEADRVRRDVIGAVGAAGDKEPGVLDKVAGFFGGVVTAGQIGGFALLATAALLVVLVVKTETGRDIAKAAVGKGR